MKDNDSAKKISQQLAIAQIKWKLADSKRVRETVTIYLRAVLCVVKFYLVHSV